MSVNAFQLPSRRRFSALFNQESKSDSGYDTNKSYPADYKHSLENEIQQWNDLMKTVNEEYRQWRGADKKARQQVNFKVIKDEKCLYEDFFDHTIYYDYINTVESFCAEVTSAVEAQKVKGQNAERENKILMSKCKYIDKVIDGVVKTNL